MKTKDLLNLIDNGVRPIIRFTNNILDIESADPNMIGRVIGYREIDVWERGTETVFIDIDLSEFIEQNKSIAKKSWLDDNSIENLTWFESRYYPKNNIEGICEMLRNKFEDSELSLIEVINDNKYFNEFTSQSEFKSYVQFLENKLDKLNGI